MFATTCAATFLALPYYARSLSRLKINYYVGGTIAGVALAAAGVAWFATKDNRVFWVAAALGFQAWAVNALVVSTVPLEYALAALLAVAAASLALVHDRVRNVDLSAGNSLTDVVEIALCCCGVAAAAGVGASETATAALAVARTLDIFARAWSRPARRPPLRRSDVREDES